MANVKKKVTTKKSTTKKSTTRKKVPKSIKVSDKKRKDVSLKEKSNIRLIQESNDYIKPVICLFVILLILLIGYLILTKTSKGQEILDNIKNGDVVITKDEKKFKEEFEYLNNSNVVSVDIKENNNVIYVSLDKVLDILDNGNGIILFGNNDDTNTRLVVSNIIDNIGDNDLYYLDVIPNGEDIRAKYDFNDFKVKKIKDGIDGYDKLLEYLDEYLSEYQIVRSNGKKTSAGVKNLEIPLLIKVKDGKIIGAVSSVGSIADYKKLIES